MVSALLEEGYEVEAVASVSEAGEQVTKQRFDAIALDLLLPDGHGEDILKTLRQHHAHQKTPVIIGSVVEPDGSLEGFPIVDFLTKPYDADALIDALHRAGITPHRPILVVDDDPAVQRLVRQHLNAVGYPVRHAANGQEALALCQEQLPALIVLDLLMPECDGFRFLEEFRTLRLGAEVPIIVWTTKELNPNERRFLQQTAHHVLQKGDGGAHTLVATLRESLDPGSDATPFPGHARLEASP